MCEVVEGVDEVVCPCPPVCNNIVTPCHLCSYFCQLDPSTSVRPSIFLNRLSHRITSPRTNKFLHSRVDRRSSASLVQFMSVLRERWQRLTLSAQTAANVCCVLSAFSCFVAGAILLFLGILYFYTENDLPVIILMLVIGIM